MKKSCLTRINLSSLEPPPGRRHRSHTRDRRRNSKLLPLSNLRPAENNSRRICRNSEPEISAICACLRRGGSKNPSLRFRETDDQTRTDRCVNTPVQVFIRRGPKNFTDRRTVKRAKKGFTAACGGFNQRDKQRVKSQSRRSKHLKGCGSKKRRREKKALCSTSSNLLELHVLG